MISNATVDVEWLEIDMFSSDSIKANLEDKLAGCSFQFVMVASGRFATATVETIESNNCGREITRVGSFDNSEEISSLISNQRLMFTVDKHNHNHLQGWSAIHFASLYMSTGLVLAPPPDGVYLSGPDLITASSQPDQKLRICEEESFPICPNNNGPSGLPSDCQCTERYAISIGGVVHGDTQDSFWDDIFNAALQGSLDMGINLEFDRFKPLESIVLFQQMADKIRDLCKRVDGLFVSLSDDVVVDAVRKCLEMKPGLPIMTINAGYTTESRDLNLLHHVGMLEFDAGYRSGKKMESMANFNKVLCLIHDPNLQVVVERCNGFDEAMGELAIDNLGQVEAPPNDIAQFVSNVEAAVGKPGDWEGYGIILVSLSLLPGALELKRLHPKLVMATFDTSDLLYRTLQDGDILFGVDQQPYLQGYAPLPILTHAIMLKQAFIDHSIKSGPSFVISPPNQEGECLVEPFKICK